MESSSAAAAATTTLPLAEQFAVIMNNTPPPAASQEFPQNSPPPSYTSDDASSALLQLFQELVTNGTAVGKGFQLTLDAAFNSSNPRVELPSDPLKDISTIVGKDLSNEEIVQFLANPGPWRPSSTYEFPFDESNKRARFTWFKAYPFCTFSYIHDGIYCVPCALRSITRYPKSDKPIQLINEPLKRFDKFSKKMRTHTETLYHRENMNYINALSPNWMNPKIITIQDEPFQDEVAAHQPQDK